LIISRNKPFDEILKYIEGCEKIVLTGCGECATACQSGGEEQLREIKKSLENSGKNVVALIVPQTSCNLLLVKKDLRQIKKELDEACAIISFACGDGVQTVAKLVKIPVYPGNDTLFIGEVERVGKYTEACRTCGECVLGSTGGICPVTRCAKSLLNGPCGGAKNGKCEVNPENDCAWILIYNKLKELGQSYKLSEIAEPKDYSKAAYPRRYNLREKDGGEGA
jgi:hypothetical protein